MRRSAIRRPGVVVYVMRNRQVTSNPFELPSWHLQPKNAERQCLRDITEEGRLRHGSAASIGCARRWVPPPACTRPILLVAARESLHRAPLFKVLLSHAPCAVESIVNPS